MDLLQRVNRSGGIARVSQLTELGHSRGEIQRQIESQRLSRPARGWVATPETDEALLYAARHHVVLSCVTQAERLKLWIPEVAVKPHVAAPNSGAKVTENSMVVHWARPMLLRRPFLLVDPIENVLAQVAECQPRETAITIWESALNRGMTEMSALAELPLRRRGREILSRCTPFSDSGLESLVFDRLRWLPVPVRQQVSLYGKRVDFLIGKRLVVQIDGATHTGKQRTADIIHDAELGQRGYCVIRLAYEQVMHGWEEAQGLILAAISRGRHLA